MNNEWQSAMQNIIDGHVHMHSYVDEGNLLEICKSAGIKQTVLVSIQDPQAGSGLPQSLYMKARHPEQFFVFAGLNHATVLSGGKVRVQDLADQVDTYVAMGCDGIKMIECKPTSRQRMNIPVTDKYYTDYWAHVEELGVPVVWHVNDPEEFWNPEKLPAWARERKWGYGPDDVQKEQLYSEVDEVLTRHPNLNIIFAHFYFLSADLPRAKHFLDAHPTVKFDLTPGIEMLYNLSHNPEESREFFMDYAQQIVYGTDISSNLTVLEGILRAGIVYRWLESDHTFRVSDAVDFLLGKPEDGIIHGLHLPETVLARIYRENIRNLTGTSPTPLMLDKAITYCTQLSQIAETMSGMPSSETEAAKVVTFLQTL
jgi:predicted TIM-barrel fold metal-dependent hydrolase